MNARIDCYRQGFNDIIYRYRLDRAIVPFSDVEEIFEDSTAFDSTSYERGRVEGLIRVVDLLIHTVGRDKVEKHR